MFSKFGKTDMTFKVPASLEIALTQSGKYYLWNNYLTIFDGQTYSQDKRLPDGMTFILKDKNRPYHSVVVDSALATSSSTEEKSIDRLF